MGVVLEAMRTHQDLQLLSTSSNLSPRVALNL